MRRKTILMTGLLALLVVAGLGYAVRSYLGRVVTEKAANQERADSAQADSGEDGEKGEPPKPRPKETVLGTAGREHLAENAFIAGLRAVLLERQKLMPVKAGGAGWLEKLVAIPSEDLPPERKKAWESLLEAWRALEGATGGGDPEVKEKGQAAALVLNAMLEEHGDGDIQF